MFQWIDLSIPTNILAALSEFSGFEKRNRSSMEGIRVGRMRRFKEKEWRMGLIKTHIYVWNSQAIAFLARLIFYIKTDTFIFSC